MSKIAPPESVPIQILTQTDFFTGLSDAQLIQVSSVCRFEAHARGEPIYKIGEVAKSLYILNRGMVRFAISYGNRDASAGDILRRGQVFGWAALTPASNVRIATASCLTSCSILAIDGAGLLQLMDQDHTLGYKLMIQLTLLITGTLTAFAGG